MTKHSDSSPLLVQHAWRGFPNRLKELIKRNATMPPLTPPMSFSEPNKSILNRLFSKSSKKDSDKNNNKYDNEWDNYTDVPLRAMTHHIPLLTQVHPQQDHPNAKVATTHNNNTNSNHGSNELGYIYVTTIAKLKNLNHYTLIQQLSLHKLIVSVQKETMNNNNGLYNIKLFQRDCLSILTNSAAATATAGVPKGVTSDFILSRKPAQSKRTRYIYMLLNTPASEIKDYVHPVADAYKKLRRPYAETATVISSDMEGERPVLQDDDDSLNRSHSLSSGSSSSCSSEITITVDSNAEKDDAKTFKFVPADYLLDPATLRRKSDTRTPGSKFGTQLNQHDGPLEPQFIFDDPILKKKRAKSILTRFKLKNMDKIQMDEVKDNYYVI